MSDRNALLDPLMGPRAIVVLCIVLDDFSQVRLMHDQHLVQAFSLQAADEPLTDRVSLGGAIGRHQPIDTGAGSDGRKSRPVLAISIVDEMLWLLSPGRGFAQLLSGPGIGWVRGHCVLDEVSRLKLDDHEDIEWPKQEVVDDGEIAGPDLARMFFEECGPILGCI